MSKSIEIYLGKGGETFGPYTVEQFEAMKAEPDFSTYIYIWDGRDAAPDWKPLEKAPAAPVAKRGPGAPPPDQKVAQQPAPAQAAPVQPAEVISITPKLTPTPAAKPVLKGYDVPGIEAVCHDSRSIVTGKLMQVTDSGCEFVSSQAAAELGFGGKSPVVLNLLDPKTGESMNVSARLNGIQRKDGGWSFRVLWNGCPQLIIQHLEKSA